MKYAHQLCNYTIKNYLMKMLYHGLVRLLELCKYLLEKENYIAYINLEEN